VQTGVLLYRPLIWPGAGATADTSRSLAAGVQVLDNATRFRVTLKPWRWSDGTSVTADDVVFGWERIEKLGGIYPYAGQGGIPDRVQSVRAVLPSQVDFVLKQPANPDWFILNGLSLIYALPRHAWGDIGRDEMWRRQTDPSLYQVVDGPFRLTDFRLDRYAAYAPNPLYGGHQAGVARLVVTFLEGDNPLHAVQAGDADIAHVPTTLWQRIATPPGFAMSTLPPSYGYSAIMLNQHSRHAAFLQDARVRRALAQAIDQPTIIRLVYRGLARENHVPVPADAPAWRSPQSRAGDPGVAYDPARAAAGLEQAGWRAGPDGVRARDGQTLDFTMLTNASGDNPAELQVLQIVQSELRAVGVRMRLRRMTYEQETATMGGAPDDWDAGVEAITMPPVPEGGGFLDSGGSSNLGGYSDPRMDQLIRDSVAQPGAAGLFAYQDYAAAQEPWIILPQGEFPVMLSRRLHGVADFQNPLGYWSPEYLWVDDGQCAAPGGGPNR
jgi:peptide/nickel transport system substrate-binding protein